MQRVDKVKKLLDRGELDSVLIQRYGQEHLEEQKLRYAEAVDFFGKTYGWDRKINIYCVPYSVLLAGDGADVSIATDMDALLLAADSGVNVSRLRIKNYTGEDNIDLYQHGPYTSEYPLTAGVMRGIQQAFLHFKYDIYGADIYLVADTVPGSGLDEAAHMAMSLAYVYNDMFNDGKLTPPQISKAVQWALANYVLTDSYATDTYSSLTGESLTGDFTNAEAEVVTPIQPDMQNCRMYTVNINTTAVDLPEEEVDGRLDAFMAKLGKDVDRMSEKEFYEILSAMEEPDCEAALFLMDYFTQENFAGIYAVNAVDGIGSPTVEQTVESRGETVGGAIKWHNKIYNLYWMALCCVSGDAQEAFEKAMAHLFGENHTSKLSFAKQPAAKVIG